MTKSNRLVSEKISVAFGRQTVLESLDVEIPDNKISVIIGPNASGKSTLLRSLARLQPLSSGQVLLDGIAISEQSTRSVARKLAMLAQVTHSFAGMRVQELVMRGRTPHQSPLRQWTKEDQEIVVRVLEDVGIADLAERRLDALSGGQRQRAWIAMVLAQQTDILLLDEPTTYLDLPHQIDLLALVRKLCDDKGLTIAMVLHDINLAARFADHLIAVRDGQIVCQGSPQQVVTVQTMADVFALDCVVIEDPLNGSPHIIPR